MQQLSVVFSYWKVTEKVTLTEHFVSTVTVTDTTEYYYIVVLYTIALFNTTALLNTGYTVNVSTISV